MKGKTVRMFGEKQRTLLGYDQIYGDFEDVGTLQATWLLTSQLDEKSNDLKTQQQNLAYTNSWPSYYKFLDKE